MPREPKDVTEAELAILQALWDQGPQSIRQLTDALHPANDPATYATVKKQLERMEAKALVHRDRSLFVHVFTAAVVREDLVGRGLLALADRFCGGSFAPILGFLGSAQSLTADERKALRRIIEGAGTSPQRRNQKRTEAGCRSKIDASSGTVRR